MISRILDEGNYSINGVSLMMISRFKPQISDICEVDCNEYNLQDEPIWFFVINSLEISAVESIKGENKDKNLPESLFDQWDQRMRICVFWF